MNNDQRDIRRKLQRKNPLRSAQRKSIKAKSNVSLIGPCYTLQQRSRATVKAILDAAARLLIQQGYAVTSTNTIADIAGVSIGSLYEYFPGKEAVFAELRRRESSKYVSRLTAGPAPETPHAMLEYLVRAHIEHVRSNLALHVALQTEVPRFAIATIEADIFGNFIAQSNAFLNVHQQAIRPKATVPFVSEFLMRVLRSTIDDYAHHSPEHLEHTDLANEIVELLSRYLLVDH